MSVVVCKLPRAGLGNQLFPLMKAYCFGYLNDLPVIVTGYHQVKIGPYLRREKNKRNYSGFFNFQKNIFSAQLDKWRLRRYTTQRPEPAVQKLVTEHLVDDCYVYTEMPHWDHYFDGLKENRELVITLFRKLLSRRVLDKIAVQSAPCIGVHIRMGDFRKLKEGEDFDQVGIVRTPETYFIDAINSIRGVHGAALPVTVFTDGFREELEQLFKLEHITLSEGNNDIEDLVQLSRSQLIITSSTSTFSYWAGFLSDAIVIMHPAHVGTVIRSKDKQSGLYEGALDLDNAYLVERIRGLSTTGNSQWANEDGHSRK